MGRGVLPAGALVVVTVVWGSTFFIIKDAVEVIDPASFLAIRFAIAAVLLSVISWRRLRRLSSRQWRLGLSLGVVYGLAQIAQTVGLRHTDASVSGFITGTYVIITPLLLLVLFRRRVTSRTWISVGLAVVGLGVLSLTGLTSGGLGEMLTLLGAALYALHIVLLDRSTQLMDALSLAAVQLIGVAVTCTVVSIPSGGGSMPDVSTWAAIVYTALIAGALAMLLQTWAQGHLSPTKVAVVMTLEPVFATAFAVALGGENLSARLVVGGALILAATVLGVLSTDSSDMGPSFAQPPVLPVLDEPGSPRAPTAHM